MEERKSLDNLDSESLEKELATISESEYGEGNKLFQTNSSDSPSPKRAMEFESEQSQSSSSGRGGTNIEKGQFFQPSLETPAFMKGEVEDQITKVKKQ